MSDTLIRQYYAYFNERRLSEAVELFAEHATFDSPPFAKTDSGISGYVKFAETWLRAFPDAQLKIEHVHQRNDKICEIDLLAVGTHSGMLDLTPFGRLSPTGSQSAIRIRELLQVNNDKIIHSTLSFDIHDLLHQLANVDCGELDRHLEHIQRLRVELGQVGDDCQQRRCVIDRIGRELDAARMVVRPWFRG
jgi:predicted ester cyclase